MKHYNSIAAQLILAFTLALPRVSNASSDLPVIDDLAYLAAQSLVAVEDTRRLNLYCTGTGSPVVILESGLGDGTKAWGLVQPEISKLTRTCSYDRAGLGFSDPATVPGTSANAVKDLRRLLSAAQETPPYVLVGHSYGGMNAKLFALLNPELTAGLVLVDPSHEDVGLELFELDPDSHVRNQQYLIDLQRCIDATEQALTTDSELSAMCVGRPGPRFSDQINRVELERGVRAARVAAWTSEMRHIWVESADQVRAALHSLADLPLVLLIKQPSPPGAHETAQLRRSKNKVLRRQHEQTVALSEQGQLIIVEDSGHYIQLDQPAAVIDAIVDVIDRSSIRSSPVEVDERS